MQKSRSQFMVGGGGRLRLKVLGPHFLTTFLGPSRACGTTSAHISPAPSRPLNVFILDSLTRIPADRFLLQGCFSLSGLLFGTFILRCTALQASRVRSQENGFLAHGSVLTSRAWGCRLESREDQQIEWECYSVTIWQSPTLVVTIKLIINPREQ